MRARLFLRIGVAALLVCLSGCSSETYPGDRLKDAISKICSEEYDIHNVDVKIADTTIGVYLPLKKLFSADFKNALLSAKVKDMQSLLEPAPDAIEKVEDVLFAISRVLLSTDRKIDFYILQATDVEKTGMALVLAGYVDDVRRVRVWDISRDEYRRRIIHELRPNRTARWHQPVRQFFDDLSKLPIEEVRKAYFGENLRLDALRGLFFYQVREAGSPKDLRWTVLDVRSIPSQKDQVIVYIKARPEGGTLKPNYPKELEYLFVLGVQEDKVNILRIIPFQYLDANQVPQKVPFPKELGIEQNLMQGDEEFNVVPMHLGPFLAEQLTRRTQNLLAVDERIHNTFRESKLEINYVNEPPAKFYRLDLTVTLTDFNNYRQESPLLHEDMLYFLNLVMKEMTQVLHAYRFEDFDSFHIKLAQDQTEWVIARENLELYRQGKIKIAELVTP